MVVRPSDARLTTFERKAANLARWFLIAFGLALILLGSGGIMKTDPVSISWARLAMIILPALVGIAAVGIGVLSKAKIRTSAALALVSLAFTAIALDIVIQAVGMDFKVNLENPLKRADTRTKLQVVEDLRASGIDAFPFVNGGPLIEEQGDRKTAHWPSGIPEVKTVFCNETGEWIVYTADRYGYWNADTVWESNADVVLVGDSFTHGACSPPGTGVAARIARAYPHTVNLGLSGTGPLSGLASLREFGATVRPKVVVWLLYANDLADSKGFEWAHSYLDPGFSRNLVNQTAAAQRSLSQKANEALKTQRKRQSNNERPISIMQRVFNTVMLRHLRHTLGLRLATTGITENRGSWLYDYVSKYSNKEVALLSDIMQTAKRDIEGWGGKLVVAYLPSALILTEYGDDPGRHDMLSAVRAAGIEPIDLFPLFKRNVPGDLFYYGGSHYNSYGYRIVADRLTSEIEKAIGR